MESTNTSKNGAWRRSGIEFVPMELNNPANLGLTQLDICKLRTWQKFINGRIIQIYREWKYGMYSLSSLLVTCSRRISVSLNLHHSKLWQFVIKTPKKSQKLRWTPKMPYSLKGDSSSKLSFLESSRSFSGLYPLDHQGLYSSFAALLDAVVALEVRLTLDKLWSNGRLEEIMKLEELYQTSSLSGILGDYQYNL